VIKITTTANTATTLPTKDDTGIHYMRLKINLENNVQLSYLLLHYRKLYYIVIIKCTSSYVERFLTVLREYVDIFYIIRDFCTPSLSLLFFILADVVISNSTKTRLQIVLVSKYSACRFAFQSVLRSSQI
jgi:hypothetical protein